MTLSEKYEEIMEKVVVTDEMRRRILQNIRGADVALVNSPDHAAVRGAHQTKPDLCVGLLPQRIGNE